MSPFSRFLDAQGFVVLDGGLATALQAEGYVLDSELWSAGLLARAPEAIRGVHAAYLQAGADCITTASYQASAEGFAAAGVDADEAVRRLRLSVDLAAEARDAFWAVPDNRVGRMEPLVAASAGPYGALLADGSEYDGRYGVGVRVLEAFHGSRLETLSGTSADLIAFETIPSGVEARVIAGLLEALPDTWAWVSFTCRDAQRLRDGTPVTEAARACRGLANLAGIGVNCTAPHHVASLLGKLGRMTDAPLVAYPNSGESYDARAGAWVGDGAGAEWLDGVDGWVRAGARVVGGCCRVGPDIIRDLRPRLRSLLGR